MNAIRYSHSGNDVGPIIDIYPCEIAWIDLLLLHRLPAAGKALGNI